MKLKFEKMQGTGNDFIMLDSLNGLQGGYSEHARRLCDRHFGIGADGLILILPADSCDNDYKMRIINSDGSEAEMCGNGIRCFSHYLKKHNLIKDNLLRIETLAGLIQPEILKYNRKRSQIRVNMGQPEFKPSQIPVTISDNKKYLQEYKLFIDGENFLINCVSMGNPHTVIFLDDIDEIPLIKWGRAIENHPIFPDKTNVEFVKVITRKEIKMRVWERGAGVTLACGTGAVASAVAGIKNGYLDKKVTVNLPGGKLIIEWTGDNCFMTGPAVSVFEGVINLD